MITELLKEELELRSYYCDFKGFFFFEENVAKH